MGIPALATLATSRSVHSQRLKMVKLAKAEGQPKRPMSAYFLWMNDEGRDAAKKALPGAGVAEISKHCGEAWKSIDESTKKKYEKKQAELKKKYDVEYPLWLENGGKELLEAAKKAKKEKKACWRPFYPSRLKIVGISSTQLIPTPAG